MRRLGFLVLTGCSLFTREPEAFPTLEINAHHAGAEMVEAGKPGHVGGADELRQDIIATMGKSREPITGCYREALARVPTLSGTIVVQIEVTPDSGAFAEVVIVHDDLGYPDLDDCVVATLTDLALEHPQRTKVSFKYPLAFSPSK